MPTPSSFSLAALVGRVRRVTALQAAAAVIAGFLGAALCGFCGAFFLLLVLALPVAAFFGRILTLQSHYEITDQEVAQLFVTFLGGVFPGAVVVVLWQLVLAPLFALICFADQSDTLTPQLRQFLDKTEASDDDTASTPHIGRIANVLQSLQVEKTFGYYVFAFLSAYVIAGLVEEATKLWVVQGTCLCSSRKSSLRGWLCDPRRLLLKGTQHPNHHVVVVFAVTAAAIGLSTIENVAFTFSGPTFSDRLSLAVLRSAVSLPLHGLCGNITGMRLARALLTSTPQSSWRLRSSVLWPAVLVHGTFDFQIFVFSSFVSSDSADSHPVMLNILVPGVLSIVVLIGAYVLRQRQWRELQMEASTKGRYIRVGADVDGVDEADDDDDSYSREDRAKPVTHNGSGPLLV